MDLPSKLEEALDLLNSKLEKKGLFFGATLLGSMALHFAGFQIQRRTDLDIYNSSVEEEIVHHHGEKELQRKSEELIKFRQELNEKLR